MKVYLICFLCLVMLVVIFSMSATGDFYVTEINGKYGFVNHAGTLVIYPVFSAAKNFSDGLAAVKVDSNWGFIDKNGRTVISPIFNQVNSFENNRARVQLEKNGGWGYIDKKGCITWVPTK